MNKKEILFTCLIICLIFSISAVSASDVDLNDTDDTVLTVSDTDAVSISNDLSSYSLSDNEIVRGENDGAGSFSDLKNLIDNDDTGTITLDKNYTYDETTDSALATSGISVSNKVIKGNGNNITIDGNKLSKIFSLFGSVTLKDITFINGESAMTAAISHSSGDLTVSNCNFIANDGMNGGALQAWGSLTMESCTFINNTAVNGGAIQTTSITTGSASITDTVFINNTASGNGGAINSPSQMLILDNVNITGSVADDEGGAIYLGYTDLSPRIIADVRITNVNIMNSSAGSNGGGIMVRGPNAVFSNINISNTNATNGGGMYIAYCPYIMEYITFTNNYASEDGGAVYFWANGDANVEAANHLIFINNTADRDAGAVYLLGNLGTIHNSTFIGNNATNNGGAIVVKGTDWYIYDCNFTNNTAINRHGGAIYLEGSTTSVIARANFINNSAGCNGGALDWHEGASEGKLINATLINNTASRSGGAIFWHGHNGTIINAAFEYNSAKGTVLYNNSYGEETYGGDGGAIIWIGDNGQIINSTFKFNNASHNGGAIFMEGSSNGDCDNITVDYCTFVSNIAGVNGGALDWYKGAHDSTLANSTFINNTANRSGGAVYWYGHNGTIFNSTFDNNRAMGNASYTNSYGVVTHGGDGGAIIWTGANGNILNSTFIRNNASHNGGAIFMEGSTNDDCTNITVDGCEFRDNYAAVNGGALDWYQGAHDATLSNSVLVNNTAGDDGGAVYWFGHDGTIVNSTFEDNRALGNVLTNDSYGRETYCGNGGAIIWTGANGKILNSTFTMNNASRNGGAIYMQGTEDGDCSNITVDGCEFRDNYAGVNGGALDWYEGAHDATLSNSVLINNTAERSGGAVYWFGHDGTIVNSTFENNRALGNVLANDSYGRETYGGHGGAVMWTGANGKILNSTFTMNNASRNGGAIYMQGSNEGDCSNITVDGSEFRDNYAGVNGGALDWYEGAHDATLSNSVLVNNTAERSGGAVYWYGHNGTIRNTTFANNKALGLSNNASDVGGDGGAVMWTGSDGLMDNCTFINNYAANRGGGMFLQGSELENCTNVTINNGIFKDNRAETNGGGVNFYIGATDGHIIGSTFDNNTAVTGIGGALVWRGHNGEVEGSSFTNNYARNDGGAAYIEGESCKLYNSTFDNNTAGDDGGAVCWTGDHGEIFNVTANNNKGISEGTSHSKGGTIIITGSNMTVDTLSVSNSFAQEEAGGLFLTGNYVNITNAKFINCSASMDHTAENITQGGGAVIIGNNTRLINVTIEDSQAERGGAIYWEGHNGYAYNITATRNYAPYDGGALYVEGDNCQLYNSEFTDNVAGDDGAAINWEGDNGHIEGCNFENSTALSMWDQYENKYHTSKGGAISITGDNLEIFNSNFTNSTTKSNGNNENYGGTLFITGENVKIDGCNFNDSVATGSDGGAIYIIGGHTEISNSTVSNSVARSGGAIYSTGSYCIVSNSNFTDNLADLSGGGIYWYGGSKSKYNTVDGCIFTNNTAHGNTTDKSITRGGGAIYWSEGGSYGAVKNSEFYNNSVQSTIKWKVDGGAILWDKSYHALVENCNFVGDFVTTDGDASGTGAASVWAQGGAMYLRPNGNYTVRNCHFENCSSSKEAGALYIQGLTSGSTRMLLLENSVFINNVAEANGQYNINGGGAIQVKQCTNVIFNNVTFINNTANKGGALCVYDSVTNFVVNGANFTENKANKGSAISASVYFKLNDAVLLDNRADTTTLDLTFDRENGGSIDILMEGADTHLNAMYVKHGNKGFTVTLNNVTYWRENNITIGQTDVITGKISSINVGSVPEAGINITVEIFDGDNNKLHEGIYATDADGRIHLEIADILTDPYSTDNIYIKARLTNEVYYTMANETSRIQNVYVDGSALDTIFHRNATVNANITAPGNGTGQAARGIVSVYIDDIFKGNMTIENSKGTLENILTNYTADEFFTVGQHNVSLKYWGDAFFDEANTTIPLNIIKANSNVTFTIEDLGYDLYMNFTVFDDWDDKAYWDANGTATVMFYAENNPTVVVKLADVRIVNGVGYAVLRDLIPRNYTIKTLYHDDNNYNDSVSETNYTLPQKDYAAVIIDVNAYDIMVNETVYINVTIVPPDGYEVPGNVTLYLDNKGYNLTLTMGDKNATAKFNMTNLTAGIKKVVAFYQGSKLLEPTKGEADFRVLKYNSTISANVTNITIVQNEVINITLLNDTTGIVSVIVDGKEYFDRIKNGTASVKLPQLPMGEYNVTLFYEGDHKYNNVTNYTVFYVGPVTPEMIIDVENVTYGNSTHIVITIPDCSEGNVSIKIDGVPFDVPKPVDNGRVEFVVEDLNAGNYTVEATYTGDTNHTAVSGEQNFTVYKANRTIDLEVQNITYGGIEHIEVYVNATGNVTIIVDGKNKTIVLNEGKATLDVPGLNASEYSVEVIYNGNENYNKAYAKATFIVSTVNTNLVIDDHNVPVWDNEYINVTVRNSTGGIAVNATGNITIYIDGVPYTANITDGVARFNITTSQVGQKVIWAFYDGDINFVGNRSMETFEVQQRSTPVEVTAQNITVGQDGKITINIPANATGYVILSGNFTNNPIYVYDFTNGVAEITADNLAVGNYSVHVKYIGDALDNYTVAENDTTFKVETINTTISIDVESIDYGNKANITVTVNNNATGHITIRINETRNITLPIDAGKVNWIVEGLAAGNYTVYANYSGDDKYNLNNTNKSFEVRQISPNVEIIHVDSTAGENATIIVRINPRVSENVTITVNSKTYSKAVDEYGIAVFTTDVIENGTYTITASYPGDKNFTADSAEYTFTANRTADYVMNITASDIYVGNNTNITVNVPGDVSTGKVIIELNGTNYTATVTNGVAVLNNISTLKEGVYNVTAYFGNDKYTNKTASTRFIVSKVNAAIKVDVDDIYVDDIAYINVTVPDDNAGTVTIEVNGKSYGPQSVENGVVRFVVPDLAYGNKTVAVTYSGTDKYVSNFTTANFTVSKRTPAVIVTNITIIDGAEAEINITGPSDRDANLIVTIDNVDYAVNMTSGNATLTVEGLSVDNYTVSVIYIENDKYVEGTAKGWVNVTAKGTSAIIIGVDDVYRVGQDIVINLTAVNSTGDINVTINGKDYPVVEGKVTITNGLPNGTYVIEAVLAEDDNYYGSSSNATFKVVKNNITITVNDTTVPATIVVDTPVTFTANLNESVTGDVTFTINGANYTVHITDSNVATVDFTPVNNNTITVVATFMGNDKYNSNVSAQKQFPVSRIATDINVTVQTSVTYGEDAVITVELNETINATVKLTVDGKEYDVAIIDGKGGFNATRLNSGEHEVNVTYVGDDKYAGSSNSTRFTVDNATLVPEVTAINVTVEQNTTFAINVTDDFNGNVSIKVGDKVLYNGSVKTLVISDQLPAGNKTVTVVFYGDSNYDELTLNDVKFTVSRVTPEMTVVIDDVTYPNKAIAVINVDNNANGTVNVTVDGKVFNGTVSNGVANVDLTDLSAGNKVATVEFFTNDEYNDNSTAGTKFIIYPNNSLINVKNNAGIYKVGEDIEIVFQTINSTGKLNIYLNGKEYGQPLYDNPNSQVVSFDGLGEGNYTVTAVLDGDQNYTGYSTTTYFSVVKNDLTITVNDTTVPATIVVDTPVTFTANLNESVTGDVIFTINGANYTVHVSNSNVATYEYTPVNNNTITVVATFMGNDKYNSNVSAAKEFNVNKLNTTVRIVVNNITYGDDENITVYVDNGVEGNITIKLDSEVLGTFPIVDGKVNIVVDNLGADDYVIYAEYNGNYKYNVNNTESESFTVSRATPVITIENAFTDANTSAVIIVHINDTATGTMNITVDGKNYIANITDGVAQFTVDVLPVGEYDITANYYALTDTNYTVASQTLVDGLTVTKAADYPMNVSAIDVKAGEQTTIFVCVPEDATGIVFIDVNGTKKNATVDHGKAIFNVTKEVAGRYVVNATLVDDKYENKSVIGNYYVEHADTPLSIEVAEPVYVNDTVIITVTVPEDIAGPVTIEINGESYNNSTVNANKVIFEVPNITYGNKTVVAIYGGDDKYLSNSTTENFTVYKRDSFITVNATDVTVDGETIINVTVPENAVGYVVVNVDGANYTINLTAAEDRVAVKMTEAGLYNVTVTYIGDDQFLPSRGNTTFTVDKLDSFINLTAADNGIVANGSDADIFIKAPGDITGKVNVTVWNMVEDINTTYVVYVNEGEGTLHLETPSIGSYNVTAIYLENRKYLESGNYTLFEVYGTAKELEVLPGDIYVKEHKRVIVNIAGYHEGNVTIIISNASGEIIRNESVPITYLSSLLNYSSAQWTLPVLDAGHYDIKAYFIETNGSKTYVHEGNNSFNVIKLASEITIKEIRNVTVGENVTIELELDPNDATGNISVFVNGFEYKTTADNLTIIIPNLNADEYVVEAFYYGDKNYNESNASSSFRVDKNTSPISVNVTNSKVGDVEQINVTLPNGTSGQVLLDIDGKHYYANVTDGLAQFNITGLKAGEYTANVTYVGDNRYLSNSTSATVTVTKYDSNITVGVEDITVGDVAAVNITVITGATGNVTITIGNEYNNTVGVVNGTFSIIVPGLSVGDKTVNVTYNGNDQFMPSSNSTDFTVGQTSAEINIVVGNITYGEVETVFIFVNATGNVTIKLDGNEIDTVDINNGKVVYDISGLNAGNYTVEAIYNGNDNVNVTSVKANFTVEKADPVITIEVEDIIYGDVENIIVHVNAEGNVTVRVVGVGEVTNITLENGYAVLRASRWAVPEFDGKASVDVNDLAVGNYPVEVIYSGNENYNSATLNADFDVLKANTTVAIEAQTSMNLDETQVMNITINNTNVTGRVIILIDGEEDFANVTNGHANYTIKDLSAGNHTVVVLYEGDRNLTESWNYTTIEVLKLTPEITVNATDITVGDKTLIEVTAPDDVTKPVLVDVNGVGYYVNITDGKGSIEVPISKEGNYTVTARYLGDDRYTDDVANDTFAASKVGDTIINATAENSTVGDKAVIEVSVPKDATGNVTITVNGTDYVVPVANGTATLVVPDLDVGNYTIDVVYNGDDKYEPSNTTTELTVSKATTDDIKVIDQGNGTVVVVVGDNATGNVTVKVGDNVYNATVVNGTAVITLDNETPGTHEIEVIYSGDDTHEGANTTSNVTIPKYPSEINATASEVTEGEPVVITVEVPEGATGNVTVYIDGKEYPGEVKDGVAVVTVDNLTAGNKTFVVEYYGDDNFTANYTIGNVTVKEGKAESEITVVDQGNGTITVVVGDNATGNVTVKVGNNTYTAEVINGTAVVTLDNETPGTHEIEVIYSGDDTHEGANTTSTVTIPKLDTPISVDVDDIKVGDTAEIVVNVPDDATGNVTIEIDGVKYTEEIKDGKATFEIENLTAGTKTIAVEYVGDDNYTGNHTTANFTVEKRTPTVDVEVSPIDVGETAEIKVTVSDNATGYVIVEIDNQTYAGEIKEGVAVVEVKGLPSGDIPINVTYLGDDQYLPSNASSSVEVSKVPSTVKVTAENITVGDKAVINVEVPKDLCGNVTVSVGGKNYTVFVSGGKGTLVIPDLEAGEYTVDAIFDGCKKYEPSNATTKFTVSKEDTDDIQVIDQNNGTITVVVGDNATGNVTVTVDGQNYTAEVINGTAVITLDNTTPGTHEIEVVYSGDDTHEGTTTNSTVTIPKLDTPISVDVDDIKVGDTATIVVNVPEDATGNVTIEIDGVKYTEEIKDGKATFNIDGLTAGNKTIAVDYVGDDKYVGNHTTASIEVSKRPSSVSAEITDINVGDNVTITVTAPEDATGQVLIDIDGVGYYVNITNGTGTIEIPRMPNGVYDVNLTYTGDDKYFPSSNTGSFNVSKVESFVIPKAEDIYVGENEEITFTVPSDATGTLTVIIGGKEYNFNLDDGTLGVIDGGDEKYTVAVDHGSGKLTIAGLHKGEYTVSVRYNGDDKYLPCTNTTVFNVLKSNSEMDVVDLGNGSVAVLLPDDATGNVTVTVDGKNYTAEVVNGTAIVDLDGATPGKHDITVTYSGDDSHNPQSADSSVTIPKYDTPISVEVDDIGVGDTAVVTVTLPENATGTVTIEINGKNYTAEVKDGKAVFNVNGLEAGEKTVAVKYSGDKNYVGNSTTGQFTVSKVDSTVKATSKDINVGKDEVITVTVPKDATGRVLVDIDGVGYYATIVNGKAKVIVPELPSGKYKATVTYEGDDKYLPSTTTTSFTVTKVKTPISATGDEVEQGQDATVVVKLPSDATGTVTITVDGKKYTTEVENGKAVFYIPGLSSGDHKVTASYSGDKKYEANDTITDIDVIQGHHNGNEKHAGVDLTMHATGNPIFILLLVILAIGSTQIRRLKK